MRLFLFLFITLANLPCIVQAQPDAALAWFANSSIENSIRLPAPDDKLPVKDGGVLLTKPVAIENPLLEQSNGMISFWLKPNWNGNDGKRHVILRIGDPTKNGLIVEKAASGMLRYVMASPAKVTASRSDVSGWKAGEWHHVSVVWMTRNGIPTGLPLWIDHTAVDGPVPAGNTFLDPQTMSDKRLWIGDESSDAEMSGLIIRNKFDDYWPKLNKREDQSQIALIYRDYFRTAPYSSIEIDPVPHRLPSDRRVVNGCPKQFGLKGKLNGKFEQMTEFVQGYGNWGDFDAKPYIKWRTSDENIATVDADGIVTGRSVGKCTLTAEFNGLKSNYKLQVIPIEQPDLDLLYVERLPRYSVKGAKWWPDEGEKVESVANIANFGYKPVPAGSVVRFELIPDSNRNFRCDSKEKPIAVQEQTINKELQPGERIKVIFNWSWTQSPVWVRVTLDPADQVPEICEANNQRCELNVARANHWGYDPGLVDQNYKQRKINLTGSFSQFDWQNANLDRIEVMLRDAVYPTTSPDGVRDSVRSDNFHVYTEDNKEYERFEDYYDGGFPSCDGNMLMLNAGIIHELGHCLIALPDYYGYPIRKESCFLEDGDGKLYPGSSYLPEVAGGGGSWLFNRETLMLSSAQNVPCGVGYDHLMSLCHLWLHPADAGQIQYFAQYRGDKFWGTQGRLMPSLSHVLQVYDINDEPLVGAQIYVYQVAHFLEGNANRKYLPDNVKFSGRTDKWGRFIFPDRTDRTYDDPDTDAVDGSVPVWNPYGRVITDTAFTSNVEATEGLCMIKIVSGGAVEFHWLPQTMLNEAFFRGEKIRGTYTIRTSLLSSKQDESEQRFGGRRRRSRGEAPAQNLRPLAAVNVTDITVKPGQEFTVDGSMSSDPEGQSLIYRWYFKDEPAISKEAILKTTAPAEPGDYEYLLYVYDGIRASIPARVKVKVAQ